MADLDPAARKRLPKSAFAVTRDGKGVLPVHDAEHARNALARFGEVKGLTAEERRTAARRILRAAHKYDVEVSDDDAVWRAAHGG